MMTFILSFLNINFNTTHYALNVRFNAITSHIAAKSHVLEFQDITSHRTSRDMQFNAR